MSINYSLPQLLPTEAFTPSSSLPQSFPPSIIIISLNSNLSQLSPSFIGFVNSSLPKIFPHLILNPPQLFPPLTFLPPIRPFLNSSLLQLFPPSTLIFNKQHSLKSTFAPFPTINHIPFFNPSRFCTHGITSQFFQSLFYPLFSLPPIPFLYSTLPPLPPPSDFPSLNPFLVLFPGERFLLIDVSVAGVVRSEYLASVAMLASVKDGTLPNGLVMYGWGRGVAPSHISLSVFIFIINWWDLCTQQLCKVKENIQKFAQPTKLHRNINFPTPKVVWFVTSVVHIGLLADPHVAFYVELSQLGR
jgi:hypothetical protein